MKKISKGELKKLRTLLKEKKARDESGQFVAEGIKIVSDMAAKGHVIDFVLVSSGFVRREYNKKIMEDMEGRLVPVYTAPNCDFQKLSSLQNSQGILALVKKCEFPALEAVGEEEALFILCDGVQDPGNLGAIIRTSVAFGVDAVLLTGETVDVYNPKVVRASSGMVLDVPVYDGCSAGKLKSLKEKGYRLLVSSPLKEASKDILKVKRPKAPLIIAFGSEGRGVSRQITDIADDFFHIPIAGGVDSLNVAAAAAITIYVFKEGRSLLI